MPRKLTVREKNRNRLALEEWAARLSDVPSAVRTKPPTISNSDLCAVYPMGDPHFGMYAWAAEAGEDFDLAIAERITYRAIDELVAAAPPAREAVILELGDFFHSDNSQNRTEASGHALDVDTRWARVLAIGLRAMVYVIKAALRKHARVTVRIVQGNHDTHSSSALALALDAHFRNERRVSIDLSPAPRWYYRFGRVLIGATHGHQCRPKNLPAAMASERSRDWGETEFRYFHFGHVHHKTVTEHPGCITESFRTLAPRDAWHAGQGYSAGRDMQCITYHRKYGERVRHTCPVQLLTARRR